MTPSLFSRHKKVAFQFSGGRDSLAALYTLKPYWNFLTVYHLDGGDQFPETKKVVERVLNEIPNYVFLEGNVADVRAQFGLPTDILPTNNTWFGRKVSGEKLQLQDRYHCCFQALMLPMYRRMKEDGITAIIRGVRDVDYADPPTSDGDVVDGFEFFYPIATWSDADVLEYLESIGVEPAPFYKEGLKTTPECMTCTAWWDDKRAAYLKAHYPDTHRRYVLQLKTIRAAVKKQMKHLEAEVANG